jgi:two-component system alkaline phosphatase synthesis response regulator PhoP
MEGIGVEFRYGPDQFIMLYFNEAGAVRSIVIRDLEICLEERVVRKKGEEVYLTHKEFELLALFIQNQSIALSREQILEHVWGYDYMGETRTVDMHVQRLRSKLGLQDAIVTVYKTGYRFDIPNQKKTSR